MKRGLLARSAGKQTSNKARRGPEIALDAPPPFDAANAARERCSASLGGVSRVPGLAVVNVEEVVRGVGSGEVGFVTQVEDAQLPSGADLSPEGR